MRPWTAGRSWKSSARRNWPRKRPKRKPASWPRRRRARPRPRPRRPSRRPAKTAAKPWATRWSGCWRRGRRRSRLSAWRRTVVGPARAGAAGQPLAPGRRLRRPPAAPPAGGAALRLCPPAPPPRRLCPPAPPPRRLCLPAPPPRRLCLPVASPSRWRRRPATDACQPATPPRRVRPMRQLQTEPVFRAPFVVGLRARRRPPRAGAFCGPASCWSSFSCLCFLAPPASRQCHFPAPVGPGPVQEPLVSRNGGPARRIVKRHPGANADNEARCVPMADRVSLSNMVFYAFHGAFDAERELGQRFEVDVDIYTDFRRAAHADDLDLALNYVHVYNIVKEIVEARP